MIEFEVPGPAVAKARARIYRSPSGHSMAYTPKKTVNYENYIKMCFQSAKPPSWEPYTGPVALNIRVYEQIPASFSKKRRQMALDGLIFPEKKPDWDNYGKIFSDALNGLAYLDDKQVVLGMVTKTYGATPGALVTICRVLAPIYAAPLSR